MVKLTGSRISTVGSKLYGLVTCWANAKKMQVPVLEDLNCIFKPATLTLVLGPTGSGKTSFLKLIAGRLPLNDITGDMTLNRATYNKFIPEKLIGFVSQIDVHYATLTVRETFLFAFNCVAEFTVEDSPDLIAHRNLRCSMILDLLGLTACADTVVGDGLLRGVSGGERRRVTLGEMMIRTHLAYAMDEISTGLDSAATYDIISSLRKSTTVLGLTYVISLLQPSPRVFELFDNIVLVANGKIAYQGPCERVLSYFTRLDLVMRPQQDVCDFLQEITNDDTLPLYRLKYKRSARGPQKLTAGEREAIHLCHLASKTSSSVVSRRRTLRLEKLRELATDANELVDSEAAPKNTHELITRFSESAEAKATQVELATASELRWNFLKTHMVRWTVPFLNHLRHLLHRELVNTARDKGFKIARIMQCLITGLINGILFFQLPLTSWIPRFGLFFQAVMFLGMGNLSQVPVMVSARAVFVKHRQAHFFPSRAFVLSLTLSRAPMCLLEAFVFGSLIYALCGLAPDFGRYLVFVVVLFALNFCMGSYIRLVGSLAPSAASATPVAGFGTVLLVLFSGYIVLPAAISPVFMPLLYLSPLALGFKALAINEFSAPRYSSDPAINGTLFLQSYQIESTLPPLLLAGLLLVEAFAFAFLMNFTFARKATKQETEHGSKASTDISPRSATTAHAGLHFTPLTLTFTDLSCSVRAGPSSNNGGPSRKPLLHGVTGYAQPGVLTALMGSSGAGKSTLLDVLAGRQTDPSAEITGDVRLNGFPVNAHFKRIVGYCQQADIHSALTTVREALELSAALRLPVSVSPIARALWVEDVLEMLELTSCSHSFVGEAGVVGGLSPDRRKRLTIGVELVANPALLFLDEPTSGLDSRGAETIMKVVKKIAQSGRTVVCTIHQPSPALFALFDRLLLLKKDPLLGGRVVFFGDIALGARELVDYFESVPSVPPLLNANPADWMLEVIGAGINKDCSADFFALHEQSGLYKDELETLQQLLSEPHACDVSFLPNSFPSTRQQATLFLLLFLFYHL